MPASKKTLKNKNTSLWSALIVLAVVVVGFLFYSQQKILKAIPLEVRNSQSQWPLPNQNYSNTRQAVNSSINSSNIKNLGVAWTVPLTGVGQWGAAATNPIVIGNTVYIQDLKSNLYSIDLISGQLKWKKEYGLDAYGPNGPAVAYGKIFIQKGHSDIAALDMNGNELWSTAISKAKTEGIDIQLIPYNNKIYVSTVPGSSNENFYTGGVTGILYALDQETGRIVWSFNTVDSANIWGNPLVNSGGGSWYPPAVNTRTGVLYFGTGNPGPWPGNKEFPNASSRPGPNLYTDSLLAIDNTNGKLSWYQQVTPHDLFDLDFQLPPILTTDKQGRSLVIGGGKVGKVVAFDAINGQKIWETRVGKHQNDDLQELPKGVTKVFPSPLGGIETPMALSDGVIYAPIINLPTEYTPTGIVIESFDITAGTGELSAVDINDGSVLWTRKFPSINTGGATVVNDLVLTSTYDGIIYALDKATGNIIWQEQIPDASINGWPAVVGDMILMPVGSGKPASLIAFKLNATGKLTGTKPVSPTPTVQERKIMIKNYSFVPQMTTIKVGTKVTWINEDNVVHTVNSDLFDSPSLNNGESFSYVFNKKGNFDYFCSLHPKMSGQIKVN